MTVIRHRPGDSKHLAAVRLNLTYHPIKFRLAPARNHDSRALFGKPLGDGLPNAGIPARN
jgi:hypothetical protein